MKLLRYGLKGEEKPGVLDGAGHIRDLSEHVTDITGEILAPDRLAALATLNAEELPLVSEPMRLGEPVAGIGKILAIGLNYQSHADETGSKTRAEPMLFSKAVTALNGPFDPIMIPLNAEKTDWEVELAVVIGTKAQYVDEAHALDHVAGYAVVNDVSERSFQKERGGQFVKGKSADTFAPLGPWLITRDEVANPQNLNLWLDLNGRRRQTGNTRDMIFSVVELVSHLSQFMTLMPGDVICTGTPAGVGLGCNPPEFMKPGDLLEFGIEGLGQQRHDIVAYTPGG